MLLVVTNYLGHYFHGKQLDISCLTQNHEWNDFYNREFLCPYLDLLDRGKTRLFFKCWLPRRFIPNCKKITVSTALFKILLKEAQKKMKIEFINCLDFVMIKTLQNCLLIFDDFWEEIYEEKDSVRFAVYGQHRGILFIFVKHNSFHQNRWSPTIDLNTTHNIFFNLPRDNQQIDFLVNK